MILIVTIILGGAVFYLMYWRLTTNKNYWFIRGVPYTTNPPLGIMKELLWHRKSMSDVICSIYQKFEKEKFVGYFHFLAPVIMIRDPELINRIIITDFSHFEDRVQLKKKSTDLFDLLLGNICGDEWRVVRHKLLPSFRSGKIKMMFKTIKECNDEAVNYIADKTDKDIEVSELMLKFTLNVIGNIAFGIKIDIFNDKDEQSAEFLKRSSEFFKPSLFTAVKNSILIVFPALLEKLNCTLINKRVDQYFRNLSKSVVEFREKNDLRKDDYLQLLIDQRKLEETNKTKRYIHIPSYQNDVVDSQDDEEKTDHLKDTIENIHSSKEIFTDDFISSQTFTFISLGGESVANGISFTILELALNQDVQTRLRKEVSDIFSSNRFDYQSISKMTYMNQVIYESLRMHPVGSVLFRVCTKDYKIPGSEVVIDKGTFIIIPTIGLYNDPQYFSEPEKFNPDRFEDMNTIPKGIFFPFGGGPRICIAVKLAMMQMKITLAVILLKYNIVLSEKTKLPLKLKPFSFAASIDGGIWVKFKKREL